MNNAPARQKAKEEREKAVAEAKAREQAEAKAKLEQQEEANRKRAEDKKRAKEAAQAEQVRAEMAFKAKQKQKQPQQKPRDDATIHPAALYPMVSTAHGEFMPLFLELTRINSLMESGLDILINNAAIVMRRTPDWPFDSIRKRVTDIVDAVPDLISILSKTDVSVMLWFGTRMDDYRQVHKTTGTTAFDLGSMEKALREAPNPPSSPHFAVLLSLMKKFQRQLLDMQNGIWRLLQLYIQEEGMQLLRTEWDIQEVVAPNSFATMTQQQKEKEELEALREWKAFAAKEVPDEEAELEKFVQKLDALVSLLTDSTRAGLQNTIECAQILTEARDTARSKFPMRLSEIDAELASMRWPLIVGITTNVPKREVASSLYYRMMAQKDEIDEAFEGVFKMVRRIDAASPARFQDQPKFIELMQHIKKIVYGTPDTILFLMLEGPSEDAIKERFMKSVPDLIEIRKACVRATNRLRALGQILADHLMTNVEKMDKDEQAFMEAAAEAAGSLAARVTSIGNDYVDLLERYIPDKKARFAVIAGSNSDPEWREWP